jgi:type IV pilus assembly protein PilN
MIKINLLPREERIRRAPLNTRLILAGVTVGVVLIAMAYGWYWLNGEVGRLQVAIRQAQADAKRFDGLAKQVDTFRAEKKRLEEMIKVIDTLVVAQGSPVQILDEVSKALPNEVWLTSLNRSGKKLEISGIAFSNFSVANLMTNLSRAPDLLKNVDLIVSEKTLIENQSVEKFTISAEIVAGKS